MTVTPDTFSPMTLSITILESSTGRVVQYVDTFPDNDDDSVLWMWSEGNYSCDCNRGRWFKGAVGDTDAETCEFECDGGVYKAMVIRDGRILFNDLPEVRL